MAQILSERQRIVLRDIVHYFIATANPVGSEFLSKRSKLKVSPATIRNIMAELEAMGLLEHPYTSAGRVPTDKGYRFYVDELMHAEEIPESEKRRIEKTLREISDYNELLWESSQILGRISRQLAIIFLPHLGSGIFEHLEIIPIASNRLFIVLSVRSGLVKTIMMEIASEVPHDRIQRIASLLNERLSGLRLDEIRKTFAERIKSVRYLEVEIFDQFAQHADKIFADLPGRMRVHIAGQQNILSQPEFHDPETVRDVVALLENEENIVEVFEQSIPREPSKSEMAKVEARATIGREHPVRRLEPYSMVTALYKAGETVGTVGVLGPKRMRYSKVIPTVRYIAECLSSIMS